MLESATRRLSWALRRLSAERSRSRDMRRRTFIAAKIGILGVWVSTLTGYVKGPWGAVLTVGRCGPGIKKPAG